MAVVPRHGALSHCITCAVITSIVCVLQGCGDFQTQKKCDLDAFKAVFEPCVNGIDIPTDKCRYGQDRLSSSESHCWEWGVLEAGQCLGEDAQQWGLNLVDTKFASAKTAFQQAAEDCLRSKTFEETDCENVGEKVTQILNDCWTSADAAAGGGFEDGEAHDCPPHWLAESVKATHPEHVEWHEKNCHGN